MSLAGTAAAPLQRVASVRWTQLIAVVLCMVLIANLQYGWTLFVNPLKEAHKDWGFSLLGWHFDSSPRSSLPSAFSSRSRPG